MAKKFREKLRKLNPFTRPATLEELPKPLPTERRRAEQEAHQRAEAERRAAEEQQRVASRRYIGRGWELER